MARLIVSFLLVFLTLCFFSPSAFGGANAVLSNGQQEQALLNYEQNFNYICKAICLEKWNGQADQYIPALKKTIENVEAIKSSDQKCVVRKDKLCQDMNRVLSWLLTGKY